MTSRANIPGSLNTSALSRLHFSTLTRAEQAAAITRLKTAGHADYTITAATGLAVEMVRAILSEVVVT